MVTLILTDAYHSNVFLQYEFTKAFMHAGIFSNIGNDLKFEVRYTTRTYAIIGNMFDAYASSVETLDKVSGILNNIHTITNKNNKIYIDSIEGSSTRANKNVTPTSNIYLFAIRDTNGDAIEITDGLRIYNYNHLFHSFW